MLTKQENEFVARWEEVREQENTFLRKLLGGLPFAMLFSLPILLFVLCVYLFLPDWYAKVSGTRSSSMAAVVVAVLLITLFFSYFRMHFKWETNEQLYLELKHKRKAAERSA
ncbi:MAG: hypothetical protein EOO01_07695 [Chitinophagaceae bacterium]|nr:MAG: hypothetical protein EOO01_07695 [Chitinophagaceae bacterium]